jgi:hypothetical protein
MHYVSLYNVVPTDSDNYVMFIATVTVASEYQSCAMRKCQCLQGFGGEIFPLMELTIFY